MTPLAVALRAVLSGYVVMNFLSLKHVILLKGFHFGIFFYFLYGTLVYGGLAFSYFQFFAMTETARRIRILRAAYESEGLFIADLKKSYDAEDMLSVRLDRLVTWKQLKMNEGRFVLASHTLHRIAKIIDAWAVVLGFSKRGSS